MDGVDQKKAQVRNMQEYISGCQAFFEKVLTDLLLRQPDDPAEFLMETIEAMPAEEKALWTKKVTNKAVATAQGIAKDGAAGLAAGGGSTMAPMTENTVQVVLKLDLTPGDEVKEACLQVLKDLRAKGRVLPGCQYYEIFDKNEENEICVLQTWASEQALENYYAQPFFVEATPNFAGLLSGPPDYRIYFPSFLE